MIYRLKKKKIFYLNILHFIIEILNFSFLSYNLQRKLHGTVVIHLSTIIAGLVAHRLWTHDFFGMYYPV